MHAPDSIKKGSGTQGWFRLQGQKLPCIFTVEGAFCLATRNLKNFQYFFVCLGTGPKMSQCVSVEMINSHKKIKQTV